MFNYWHNSLNMFNNLHNSLNMFNNSHNSLNMFNNLHNSLNMFNNLHNSLNLFNNLQNSLNMFNNLHNSLNMLNYWYKSLNKSLTRLLSFFQNDHGDYEKLGKLFLFLMSFFFIIFGEGDEILWRNCSSTLNNIIIDIFIRQELVVNSFLGFQKMWWKKDCFWQKFFENFDVAH